jgi:hypothetical protein
MVIAIVPRYYYARVLQVIPGGCPSMPSHDLQAP